MQRREFNLTAAAAAAALSGCGGGGGGDAPAGAAGSAPAGAASSGAPVADTPAGAPGTAAGTQDRQRRRPVRDRHQPGQHGARHHDPLRRQHAAQRELHRAAARRRRVPRGQRLQQEPPADPVGNAAADAVRHRSPTRRRSAIVGAARRLPRRLRGATSPACSTRTRRPASSASSTCTTTAATSDFVYQADGSVIGLVERQRPADPCRSPPTPTQVQDAHLRAGARRDAHGSRTSPTSGRASRGKWKNHPGFGGYGLMNEPHDMPAPGRASSKRFDGTAKTCTIWPTFAQAAINAIRAVDAATPDLPGRQRLERVVDASAPTTRAGRCTAANIIYEVHMYLDAYSNGQCFDWDTEVAQGLHAPASATCRSTLDTGVNRLQARRGLGRATRHQARADRDRHADRRPALAGDRSSAC